MICGLIVVMFGGVLAALIRYPNNPRLYQPNPLRVDQDIATMTGALNDFRFVVTQSWAKICGALVLSGEVAVHAVCDAERWRGGREVLRYRPRHSKISGRFGKNMGGFL